MNMISTGSFLTETGASNKQSELVKKLTAAWEKKNSKTARAGGASLMALSLAACGGEDNTPFSQADIDAAKAEGVASVDITSDNAAAMTSNDAEIAAAAKTEALTAADGTIYATVDAAYTAGSNLSNADAVTAALTGADGTVYATVDAAVTAGADGVDITTDNQAAIDAEMAGTGFATVAELLAAYNEASAATPAKSFALTTSTDVETGTTNNDAFTATSATVGSADVIVDSITTDSDTITITASDDLGAAQAATISNIETVNYNLDAATTGGTAAEFAVAMTNVSGAKTVNVAVTKVGSSVTSAALTDVRSTTINSDLTLSVAGVANADLVINATKATSQTISAVTGTTDDLTINGSAATRLTVQDADAEENIVITNSGGVTIENLSAGTDTAATLTVEAGGSVLIVDNNNAGSGLVSVTTTSGNIDIGAATDLNGDSDTTDTSAGGALEAGDFDATGSVTLHTDNGNVTVEDAADAAGTLTITAVGDGDANASGADGDVTVTAAGSATAAVITASGGINIDDLDSATALTLSAGQASTLDKVAAVKTLTLTGTAATGATTFTAGTGGGELAKVDNIVFSGDKDVTLIVDAVDLESANADATGGTIAAAVIATDNSTATSRIQLNDDLGGLTNSASLNLSALAVDEIAIGAATNMANSETLTLASGANVVIASDLTALALTGAAVPGNTLTITVEDDSAATDTTGYTPAAITTTNFAEVTLQIDETELAIDPTTLNVGAANTLKVAGAGALTVGTSVTAKEVDASGLSGVLDITMTATTVLDVTGGSAGDEFTLGAEANYIIDGGDGVDNVTLNSSDFSGNSKTLSITNVESITTTTTTAIDAADVTGKSLVIKSDAGAADAVTFATGGTGDVADISGISAVTATLTLTGGAGADTLKGSLATATTINAAGGADDITGGNKADSINASTGNDSIFAGEGADAVYGGAGADVIDLTESTSAIDHVIYGAIATDASLAGSAGGTFAGYDVITGFAAAKDIIQFDADSNATNLMATGAVSSAIVYANANFVVASTAAATASNDLTAADMLNIDKVVTFMNDGGYTTSRSTTDDIAELVAVTFGDQTALYAIDNDNVDAVVASEIYMLATIDAVITAANLDIA